jgi:transposase-like protein
MRIKHMRGIKKKISVEKKNILIEESFKRGCVITELGKAHGISAETIYGWRSRHRKKLNERGTEGNGFVEVAVIERTKGKGLQKANLVFDGVILSVEGKINSARLLEIVKILEGGC